MLPFFIIFVSFLFLFTAQLRRNNKAQSEVEREFWKREQEANSTRRKDISTLDYIQLPDGLIPGTLHTKAETELLSLKNSKMLNLTSYSNTDLKLMYGVSNLDALTNYEATYVKMIASILVYSEELLDAGDPTGAQKLLEFAVSCRDDSLKIYTSLASLYRETGQAERIQELATAAGELESGNKDMILSHLRGG